MIAQGCEGLLRLRAGRRLQGADRRLCGAAEGAAGPYARQLRLQEGLHLEGGQLHYARLRLHCKLDGVGPNDNRPSTD